MCASVKGSLIYFDIQQTKKKKTTGQYHLKKIAQEVLKLVKFISLSKLWWLFWITLLRDMGMKPDSHVTFFAPFFPPF